MRHALLLALLPFAASCSAPTLQQRQDNWRRFRTGVMTTCVVGAADPAMPNDVRLWCEAVSK